MKKTTKTNKKVNFITAEGLQMLKDEYEKRVNEERNEIASKIDEARKFGDLSENNAYTTALEQKNFNEARIAELEGIIYNSKVVKGSKDGKISLGSIVYLKSPKGVVKYKVVGVEESDPEKNWISDKSPLGRSLIGKKQGNSVEVNVPSGKMSFSIDKVE